MNADDQTPEPPNLPTYRPPVDAREFVQKVFSQTPETTGLSEHLTVREEKTNRPPLTWREFLAVPLGIILVDTTLYHSGGFAGPAAVIFFWALLLAVAVGKPFLSGKNVFFFLLIVVTSLKLLWCGFGETLLLGFVLLFLFGLIQSGRRLVPFDIADYLCQTVVSGGQGFADLRRFLARRHIGFSRGTGLAVAVPLLTLVIFATIFVFANPLLIEMVREGFRRLNEYLLDFADYLPGWLQVLCWVLAAWILIAMLRPYDASLRLFLGELFHSEPEEVYPSPRNETEQTDFRSPYFFANRNTLVTVVLLFTVYLVFEFHTQWTNPLKGGGSYSDYCHRGAAWLVVALSLSTAILSLMFTDRMFKDPRVGTLKRLAWIWSALNFILVVAVFNRLFIYIGFNGMTRMRVIGLLGVAAVLVGFVMVVRKITGQKSFSWLLGRFTWVVCAMIFLDLVLPVDGLIHRYNVARILRDDPAPSVQLSIHPCSNEGYLVLLPLAENAPDETIREGIRAKLSRKHRELLEQRDQVLPGQYRWTRFQIADTLLLRQLEDHRTLFERYENDSVKESDMIRRFDLYVYRWY